MATGNAEQAFLGGLGE